ncbi:hypothetical protein ATANTOWER_027216 [Ataeniobius toweri]|uniref:Uncharacterized protein n=1 Tax=Ataeniobius toweri TaxID=208326 RepID=A0ABU7BIF3_9TELE|nr:hypothetical protein [Ataeniobius toweri]
MFFCDLRDDSLMLSWSNFGRPASPLKVLRCSTFSACVDNSSHCGENHSRDKSLRFWLQDEEQKPEE